MRGISRSSPTPPLPIPCTQCTPPLPIQDTQEDIIKDTQAVTREDIQEDTQEDIQEDIQEDTQVMLAQQVIHIIQVILQFIRGGIQIIKAILAPQVILVIQAILVTTAIQQARGAIQVIKLSPRRLSQATRVTRAIQATTLATHPRDTWATAGTQMPHI